MSGFPTHSILQIGLPLNTILGNSDARKGPRLLALAYWGGRRTGVLSGVLSEPTPVLVLTSITLASFMVMTKVPMGTYLPGLVSVHFAAEKGSSQKPAQPQSFCHAKCCKKPHVAHVSGSSRA